MPTRLSAPSVGLTRARWPLREATDSPTLCLFVSVLVNGTTSPGSSLMHGEHMTTIRLARYPVRPVKVPPRPCDPRDGSAPRRRLLEWATPGDAQAQ